MVALGSGPVVLQESKTEEGGRGGRSGLVFLPAASDRLFVVNDESLFICRRRRSPKCLVFRVSFIEDEGSDLQEYVIGRDDVKTTKKRINVLTRW